MSSDKAFVKCLLLFIFLIPILTWSFEQLRVEGISKEDQKNIENLLKDLKSAPANISQKLVKHGLVDSYDLYYQFVQENCLMISDGEEELNECMIEIADFDKINELIGNLLGNDNLPAGEGIELLAGIELDGDAITYNTTRASDPHANLYEESQTSPGRNSILLKGHSIGEGDEKEMRFDLEYAICELNKQGQRKTTPVFDKLILGLESALVDQQTSLADKKRIFCVLKSYYEQNDLIDKLLEFLFLNMPEGENFCAEL